MKVILVGRAKGWQDAPDEGNIWGIYVVCLYRPCSMVWHMHKFETEEYLNEPANDMENERKVIEYVNEDKIPMMCLKKHDNIPTSMEFPLDEMPLKYAESSIGYMIWYAYHIGATEIEMYGINMAMTSEYRVQLKNVEYWIGYVRGKGVRVTVNEPTEICKGKQGLYGYDYVDYPKPEYLHIQNEPDKILIPVDKNLKPLYG